MVLNVSENVGRASGGFLGGLTNNPGTIIIVAIVAALVLFRGDIRNAFASGSEALANLGNFQLPDIQLPTIEFPTFEFPTFEFPTIEFPDFNFEFPTLEFPDVGGALDDAGQAVGGALGDAGQAVEDFITEAQEAFDKFLAGKGGISMTTDITETPAAEGRASDRGRITDSVEDDFGLVMDRTIQEPIVQSLLPGDQIFGSGGPGFIGGTIFENPIDTLSEVLQQFPQLSASQAADFLSEFSGILPSELEFIDPDVKNIFASVGGENIQVGTVTPEDLKTEEIKAACTSCELFNLNCDICNQGLA